jgi:hypothetical protein
VVTVVGGVLAPLGLLAALALVLGHAARAGVPPDAAELARWAVGVAVVGGFLRFSDVTSWSLHPFYKRRLSAAFAVQRYVEDGEVKAREVPYEEVLDLDGYTTAAMVDDPWEGAAVPDAPGITVPFPELLVCAAANVSDAGATPPGTDVTGFVYSPGTVGGPLIGEMATPDYVAMVGQRRRLDATLPAAVAMSGAAVAPAMGRMTLGPLRLALALANVRLGVWMPSPRRGRHPVGTGGRATRLTAANPSPVRLLWEAIGRHPLESRYVYVTDGGHHENLGLVELVRRRCSTVFCFDAAGGPHDRYATLAEAIAVARAETGVDIEIDPTTMRGARQDRYLEDAEAFERYLDGNVVSGRIHYPDGSTGRVHFAKACLTRDTAAPWHVRAYAERDDVFPSHPTVDQLYSGERFEAYRALGEFVGRSAVEAYRAEEADGPGAGSASTVGREPTSVAPAPVRRSHPRWRPRRFTHLGGAR